MKAIVPQEVIEQKIYVIQGHKVMIDRDLAALYGVETRALNQAVKRNINRFPDDFMIKLTRGEVMRISQIVISLKFSKNVYVFTEQGVAMLSTVLNSERAIQVNIAIMRAFVKFRNIISTHKELAHKLKELERKTGKHLKKHDVEIQAIFEAIRQLMIVEEKPKPRIGFKVD